ncbi:MAG TPA: glycine cleavage system aminomethyltransferase GcvT [Solirubrobacteraceae bacterium]|jgi:aminomethyltransferase|nr:glycine cleavage system aminomethyltransferase GcvT [Solirubrobacteraceae bacterium]
MSSPRRTPLYDRHVAAGAKIVDFAGWEMPVEYPAGLRAEHMAVRESCGIFDVSHMGQIETRGPRAQELLQRLLSNEIAAIPLEGVSGGAQYSLLCRDDGGILDDLFTYRLGQESYLTVTNAANHERDLDRFVVHMPVSGVEVIDRRDQTAMLAVQGPAAREIVQQIATEPLPARMRAQRQELAGVSVLVCGTGYTGEDGVEILCEAADAVLLWDELMARGAVPAGLGARDTLRTEACFHLYGNDLSVERNPIEAGLGWCCKEDTGFIGAEAVAAMRAQGPPQKLVAFAIEGQGIARAGNEILGGGIVTSGTLSPCLGVAVGLAYVPAECAAVGSRLQIDVRGRVRNAVVRKKPLFSKS